MSHISAIPNDLLVPVPAGIIKIEKAPKILQILGLGSCIALSLYFPPKKVGGLAHVMLPSIDKARTPPTMGKYADSAIIELIRIFKIKKIPLSEVKIKLVGASRMFPDLKTDIFKIAKRNYEVIKEKLLKLNLSNQIESEDIGGTKGRSYYFFLNTGQIRIYYAGGKLKAII